MAAVAGIYGFSEERHTRYSDLRQHHTLVIVIVSVESHSVDVLRKNVMLFENSYFIKQPSNVPRMLRYRPFEYLYEVRNLKVEAVVSTTVETGIDQVPQCYRWICRSFLHFICTMI
uniref:Uncharacterized protein n=1 Tax=Vespula pensylvanica TaxID=30213 RepID=A0A834KCH1_VESPE|nr:hypothetical protein H0235_014882 [Vespula pensylvanica]